jgi:hypothetical protein
MKKRRKKREKKRKRYRGRGSEVQGEAVRFYSNRKVHKCRAVRADDRYISPLLSPERHPADN